MTLRCVLADDEALVREGVRLILEAQPDIEVVAECRNGAEAHRAVREHGPDVLLLDLRMPEVDGLEAMRRIAADRSPTAVLVLTTFDLDEYVYEAVRAGASGFVLKDTEPAQLVHAVRAVASGSMLFAPSVTQRLVERFAPPRPDPHAAEATRRLTARELDVLGCLAEGLSNEEIAQRLHLGGTTVKTHVARVLDKLGLRDRVQVVVFAYESGLVEPRRTT
jgi:DNA-binding NarL/FixJ family response regulator